VRLLLAATALGAALAGCGGSDAAEPTWETVAPLLRARSAHAVVTDGTRVFALGGTGAEGEPVLDVERFDGTRWVEETTLPGEGLNAPAAALVDGRIYVLGGFGTTTNVPTANVRTYDIASRRWGTAAPLPEPRGGHAAVVLAGKIHVLGGGNDVETLALHSVYDPATDRWSEAAPLKRARGSPAAVVLDGKIWAIGGRSGLDDFGDVEIYDPAKDSWSPGPSIPARGTAGAAVLDGAIHIFGGESQAASKALGDVLRLDGDEWRDVSTLPTPRSYARAVTVGDKVLVVGGSTAAGASHSSQGSKVVERFTTR
jgi:N-acetylneuraminic acid mutarotase